MSASAPLRGKGQKHYAHDASPKQVSFLTAMVTDYNTHQSVYVQASFRNAVSSNSVSKCDFMHELR